MNLPNKLTVFRIILVPIMVIIPFIGIEGDLWGIPISYLLIDLVFVLASITDKLDGYIARSKNQVTAFGKFLDPLADKILVLAAMLMLVEMNKLPAWIPIIVLAREFLVSGYRLSSRTRWKSYCSIKMGKIKNSNSNDSNNFSFLRFTCIWRMFFRKSTRRRFCVKYCSYINDDSTDNSNNFFWNRLYERYKELCKRLKKK